MKYKNNSEALKILKKYQNEIDMVKRNPKDIVQHSILCRNHKITMLQ